MDKNDLIFLASAFFLAAGNQLQPNTAAEPNFGEKSALRKACRLWDAWETVRVEEAKEK